MTTAVKTSSDLKVELLDSMGDDLSLARAAWVSTKGDLSKQQDPDFDPERFLGFLMANRHGTPFEHGALTYFVSAPIFVFREFHRHRIGFSYNEESGRYKVLDGGFYTPAPHRPLTQIGSPGKYSFTADAPEQPERWAMKHESDLRAFEVCQTEYEAQLAAGIPKEMARTVLPVATYSSMYVTLNPRSLMSFLSLRTKAENSTFPSFPQWEIDAVATQMERQAHDIFPVTLDAFHKHGRVSP